MDRIKFNAGISAPSAEGAIGCSGISFQRHLYIWDGHSRCCRLRQQSRTYEKNRNIIIRTDKAISLYPILRKYKNQKGMEKESDL